jgi:hypothetical protein
MPTFFCRPERYSFSDLSDQILTMQTDYSWPKESECLEKHGLKDARRVLDIGSGNVTIRSNGVVNPLYAPREVQGGERWHLIC